MMMIMIAIVKHPLKFTLLIIQPGPSDDDDDDDSDDDDGDDW